MSHRTSGVRIERIEVVVAAIPYLDAHPAGQAWYDRTQNQLVVKIHADGIVGIGECFSYGAPKAILEVIEAVCAPLLLGKDASDIPLLTSQMERAVRICGRSGIAAFAVAALEIALWDLAGRAQGVPVHALLGGSLRHEFPVYISLPRYDTPRAAASECVRMAGEGFTRIKLHQTDLQSVIAARQAVGPDVDLMLDANAAWSLDDALRMAAALEPLNLAWLEEPIWPPEDHASLARLRAATSTPISMGENEYHAVGFVDCVRAGSVDVLQPSVSKIGLGGARKVAELVGSQVRIVPHSFYFGPALAATAHFVSTLAGDGLIEFPLGDLRVLDRPLSADGGTLTLTDGPGLGVELDERQLTRHGLARRDLRPDK